MKRNRPRRALRPDTGGWLPAVHSLHLAPGQCDWLQEPRSLTARILRAAGPRARFSLAVLYQGYARPQRDEAALIGVRPQQRVLVRDVVLKIDGVAVVYAHTVLAAGRTRHPWPWLDRIGQKPLGSILFTRPGIRPGPHHYRRLDRRHALYQAAIRHCATESLPLALPARRACFYLAGSPLLVSEVFLPALFRLPLP